MKHSKYNNLIEQAKLLINPLGGLKMTRLCHKCNEFKKDVTGYIFNSVEVHHTLRCIDLCIVCRDKILGFIDASQQGVQAEAEELGVCEHMAKDGHFCTHIGDVVQ